MLKCRLQCTLVAAVILLLSGCRKFGEPGTAETPQAAPASGQTEPGQSPAASATSALKERHHRIFQNGTSLLIVSMSPETIVVHDGHAPIQHFSLTYEIDHSEKATKAYIQIYAPGVGNVQTFAVDAQPRGQIEFLLDASELDLGPAVRFRAHCPFGDTDWFTMGSPPAESPQPPSSQQIGDVFPPSIDKRSIAHGVSVSVRIDGARFTPECTAEAKVNDDAVELKNVKAENKRITAQFPGDALQGRPVAARYLEVLLVVEGPGMPSADTYNLGFAE